MEIHTIYTSKNELNNFLFFFFFLLQNTYQTLPYSSMSKDNISK